MINEIFNYIDNEMTDAEMFAAMALILIVVHLWDIRAKRLTAPDPSCSTH